MGKDPICPKCGDNRSKIHWHDPEHEHMEDMIEDLECSKCHFCWSVMLSEKEMEEELKRLEAIRGLPDVEDN